MYMCVGEMISLYNLTLYEGIQTLKVRGLSQGHFEMSNFSNRSSEVVVSLKKELTKKTCRRLGYVCLCGWSLCFIGPKFEMNSFLSPFLVFNALVPSSFRKILHGIQLSKNKFDMCSTLRKCKCTCKYNVQSVFCRFGLPSLSEYLLDYTASYVCSVL